MKVKIVAVGKSREEYFNGAIKEYLKRLSRFCTAEIVETAEFPPKNQAEADIRDSLEREAEKILPQLDGFVIVTDLAGKLLSSLELSQAVESAMSRGQSAVTVVIGGSNGLSDKVKLRADLMLSFGKLTFPHQLMRVIVAEQLYRVFAIINGLPYHK